MNYSIDWLESAIVELKKSDKVNAVNGDMTIEEFIKEWESEELDKVVKAD